MMNSYRISKGSKAGSTGKPLPVSTAATTAATTTRRHRTSTDPAKARGRKFARPTALSHKANRLLSTYDKIVDSLLTQEQCLENGSQHPALPEDVGYDADDEPYEAHTRATTVVPAAPVIDDEVDVLVCSFGRLGVADRRPSHRYKTRAMLAKLSSSVRKSGQRRQDRNDARASLREMVQREQQRHAGGRGRVKTKKAVSLAGGGGGGMHLYYEVEMVL